MITRSIALATREPIFAQTWYELHEATNALKHVDALMNKLDESSPVVELVKLLKATNRMTIENYLPWCNSFEGGGMGYIGRITPQHLQNRVVVWGIDPRSRIYIAFQYVVTQKRSREIAAEREYAIIFNRSLSTHHHFLSFFSHFRKKLKLSSTNMPDLLHSLSELFTGHSIEQPYKVIDRAERSFASHKFSLPTSRQLREIPLAAQVS